MRKIFFLIFTLLILVLFWGCNPEQPFFDERAKFVVKGELDLTSPSSSGPLGAPSLADASITPHEYFVLVRKYELLKSADDPDPFVVYEEDIDFALVELTAAEPVNLGIGRIDAGTYTHCRVTLVALAQQIDVYDSDSTGDHFHKNYVMMYEDFDNSSGTFECMPEDNLLKGEVLVMEDDGIYNWFQIDELKNYTYSLDKSSLTPYSADTVTDEQIKTIEFTSPVTIKDNHTYSGSITFSVADTFIWEDLDDDLWFEPHGDDHGGTKVNDFYYKIAMPEITIEVF